jgi:hypothetical protein
MKKHLCPACGQKIENGQNFCSNCGCPLSWVDCPACGQEIENGQNFCPNCGCSITLKEEQSVETSPTEEVIEKRSPVLEEATKKVTILGDSNTTINWTAAILKNDIKIGEISPNKKVELDIDEECYLKFKCSLGTAICKVKPGDSVVVYYENEELKSKVTNGTNDINNKSTIIIALFLIVVFMVAGITVQKGKERERVEQERIEQQRLEQVQSQKPRYKNVSTAINDGTIHYGMTFEEIVEICGYPSDGVTKENGKVSNAYYNNGNFVLRFDHGRWNGRYTEY